MHIKARGINANVLEVIGNTDLFSQMMYNKKNTDFCISSLKLINVSWMSMYGPA